MLFNRDWWFGSAHDEQVAEAKRRCAASHFPAVSPESAKQDAKFTAFYDALEVRTVLYLRDGFSYEVKDLVQHSNTTAMTFECMPADEAYRVGCFVVTVPYDDIVRVEVFAVHREEKPEDMPSIKGFAGQQPPPGKYKEERTPRRDAREFEDGMAEPTAHVRRNRQS